MWNYEKVAYDLMFTNILINKFKNIFEPKKIKNLLINKWETSLKKMRNLWPYVYKHWLQILFWTNTLMIFYYDISKYKSI
jgi:hypothetical protein